MNFRLTAALFGLVTLLLLGLLASTLTHDPKAAVPSGRVVAALAAAGVTDADIDAVVLSRTEPAAGSLTFAKPAKDSPWAQTEPARAKLDQGEVAGLVRALFRLSATPFGELSENLTTQGLNPPTLSVTLKGLGQELTVNFGRTTAGGPEKAVTFVTTSANPKRPFAVKRADLNGLLREGRTAPADGPAGPMAKWAGDYRVRRFLGGARDAAGEATAVTVESAGKALELARVGPAWQFVRPAGYGRADEAGGSAVPPPAAPFDGVRPLVTSLAALEAAPEDFVDAPDPAATGLDGPAAVRVTLTGPGRVEEVLLGKPVLGPDGKPVAPARVYARVPGETGAAKVPFDRLDSLRATLDAPRSLRDRDLVPPSERTKLDALDLTVGPDTVKLRRVPVGKDSQWVVYGGPAGPVPAKTDPVNRLVDALSQPRAGQDLLPELNDTAVTGPALQATVKAWAGTAPPGDPKAAPGAYPPEPTPATPPAIELAFGKREGDRVYARGTLGDAKTDYKLSDALVNLALTPRLAWVDPKFASFNRAKAETISYSRDGQTYELKRAGEDWGFAQPERLKGKLADTPRVQSLLDQLAGITAQTVLAEKPTAEQLQRASLDVVAPRLRVTVAVRDGAERKLVYEFGTDTEDGRAVYFRQMGVPMLTRADRRPLDAILGGDLRDRTVYRIDPAAVTRLQLRGRFGAAEVRTVAVERKGGTWVSPDATFKPDPAKVDQLVARLAAPRCEEFVGPGKPEYGTDVTLEPRAVEIVVDRTGGPPVSLVLGADAPGGLVHGASSAAAEAFTLKPGPFAAYVASPAGLAK